MGAKTDTKVNVFTDGNKTEKSQEAVLLGITNDDKLSFKMHFENICRTVKSYTSYIKLQYLSQTSYNLSSTSYMSCELF